MPRRIGVTIIAVLSFLAALTLLLAGLAFHGTPLPQITPQFVAVFGMIAGCGFHILGALILQLPLNQILVTEFLTAALFAAIGLGLLKLQNWARWLVIVLCILELIMAVVGYTVPRFLAFRMGILNMAVDSGALIFLLQPKVKEVFMSGAN